MLAVRDPAERTSCGREVAAGTIPETDAESTLHRDEAVGLMFAVHDILGEVRARRELLEDDGQEEEESVGE